jgi:hypothetical protein
MIFRRSTTVQPRFRNRRVFVFPIVAVALFAGAWNAAWADGLIANWTMNDPVGSTTVQDESGNGHAGALPTGAGAATLGVPAVIGTGISLPGASDGRTNFISVPPSTAWGGDTNFTMSAWIEFPSMPSLQYIFNMWPADSDDSSQAVLRMGVAAIPAWQGAFYCGSSFGSASYSPSPQLSTNTWHLITATWNGDPGVGGTNPNGNGEGNSAQSRLYLDGVYVAESETVPNPNLYGPFVMNSNTSLPLAIGGGNQPPEAAIHEWNGGLNDLAMWNVRLSDAEVAALYDTPMYNGHTGALSQYGAGPMDKLFTLYDSASAAKPAAVTTANGTLGWRYVSSGLTAGAGLAGQLGNGMYFVQLDNNGGGTSGGGVETVLSGDANLDGKVDINDLTIVLAHYGQSGATWTQGDFTGSGKVDINDLTIVLAHYGVSIGSSTGLAAVPEPSTLALIGIGLVGLLSYAWRRPLGAIQTAPQGTD